MFARIVLRPLVPWALGMMAVLGAGNSATAQCNGMRNSMSTARSTNSLMTFQGGGQFMAQGGFSFNLRTPVIQNAMLQAGIQQNALQIGWQQQQQLALLLAAQRTNAALAALQTQGATVEQMAGLLALQQQQAAAIAALQQQNAALAVQAQAMRQQQLVNLQP